MIRTEKYYSKTFFSNIDTNVSVIRRRKFFLRNIKGALSGLRQFLATESLLKMMKNAFNFTSKVLKILKLMPWLFGHVAKHLD